MSELPEIYYRVHTRVATVLWQKNVTYWKTEIGYVYLTLDTYRVKRRTDNGIILENGKYINNNWKKKFAYPTAEEARINHVERTKRYLAILKDRLTSATAALNLINGETPPEISKDDFFTFD